LRNRRNLVLHYRRYGKGTPLIMQHGFLGGSGYWVPQFPAFGSAFDIVAPDLPGFAGSAAEPPANSIEAMAAAVMALADALEIDRFHLLGHSMGGMVAQQIALDHPHRLNKLVLYGTASLGDLPKRFETLEASRARLQREGIEACARRIVPTWFVEGEAAPYYDLCYQAGRGVTAAAAEKALAALGKWNVGARLNELRMPTLVICGDRDRSISLDQACALAQDITDSRLCIAPGCAHNVHLERPAFFAHAVREFLLER
jgi:pimeloyl-ACP methyl ester carboxylesterase